MFVNDAERWLWILWLVACPLGPILGFFVRRHWKRLTSDQRRGTILVGLVPVLLTAILAFTPWSFRGFWADAITVALAYVEVMVLCWLPPRRRLKPLGWFLPAVSVVIALIFGVATYTGIFLLVFADKIPRRQIDVGPGLVARVTAGGMVTHWYEIVSLVWQPQWVPFLEKELEQRTFKDESDCDLSYLKNHQPPDGHYSIVCYEEDRK
jgi:MFS family permease